MASSRKTTSSVWSIMEKTGPETVTCTICKHSFKHAGGSTSNLMRHIKAKHLGRLDAVAPVASEIVEKATTSPSKQTPLLSQPTIAATLARSTKYSPESRRKTELDKLVLAMIVSDLQPFSVVEDRGFINLTTALDPRYQLPSRRHLSRELLPKAYADEKRALKNLLDTATHVSVSTDIWTSRQTEAYITVTAHFISSSWELHSAVLGTLRMTTDHTAANIASVLRELFEQWDIAHKIMAVVTDNASNMVASIRDHLTLRHFPCFAHTLNLVVRDALKSSGDLVIVIKRVKAVVSYFHHSVKAADKLKVMQLSAGQPVRKLIQDVDTRWNSTLKMLRRYTEEHQTVSAMLCMLSKSDMCLTDEQVALMITAVEVLHPFDLATEEMSAEKKTTVSKVLPIIQQLSFILTKAPSSALRNELQNQLDRRFRALEENFLTGASAMLDPRFKRLPFSSNETAKKIEDRLTAMLRALYADEERPSTSYAIMEEDSPGEPEPSQTLTSLWGAFDKVVKQMQHKAAPSTTGPSIEFQRYMESPILKRDVDPLVWWKENEPFFPKISKLARQFLNIPATSVPSERLFSKAGELVSARRSCLKSESIDMILFLNKNM